MRDELEIDARDACIAALERTLALERDRAGHRTAGAEFFGVELDIHFIVEQSPQQDDGFAGHVRRHLAGGAADGDARAAAFKPAVPK